MEVLALIADYLSDQEEGMKNLITCFFNQVMLIEALQQAGAAQYERTDVRKAYRNGYKDRSLKTRYGELTLRKPQFREFPFETQVFDRYSRVEKVLVNAIAESYLQGVSTRRVKEIVAHLGVEQLSPALVSRMARELDDQVQEFLMRPIEQPIPYLFVDASYYKVLRYPYSPAPPSAPVSCRFASKSVSEDRAPALKMSGNWSGVPDAPQEVTGRRFLLTPLHI